MLRPAEKCHKRSWWFINEKTDWKTAGTVQCAHHYKLICSKIRQFRTHGCNVYSVFKINIWIINGRVVELEIERKSKKETQIQYVVDNTEYTVHIWNWRTAKEIQLYVLCTVQFVCFKNYYCFFFPNKTDLNKSIISCIAFVCLFIQINAFTAASFEQVHGCCLTILFCIWKPSNSNKKKYVCW